MRRINIGSNGFTLFEVLIALAVFMLAVVGIAKALDTALQAALEARQRTQCRQQLESRLAYCLADPPQEGTPRILPAEKNKGVRVEETLTPYAAKNAKDQELQGLKKLKIVTKSGNQTDVAEILLNRP
jgi:type II secretory pathway component PulJ